MTADAVPESRGQVRVSVVVPVFDPGPAFDDLLASLDRQTLDPAEFEVLLCDDGSDDDTRDRLKRASESRSNLRVLHLPHTGWPGTPRNHGIDAARGRYIQFVDQDDFLFDAALQKLCDYADAHGSDVVIGKEVGIGRELPTRIFRRDVPRATLDDAPLLEMLTPHKMFRTAFLREHGIRFPDGRVRLEDHLFVMRAYFAAATISILASEPCYAWVKHPGSASSSRIDAETYFPHLESVLDLVEAHTEPGARRDRLLRHWFRGKILKRLEGRRMLAYPPDYRDRLLDVVVPLAHRRFGPGVDAGLSLPHRIRGYLLREDRRADLVRFAEFEAGLRCRATIVSAAWSRGGGLHLKIDIALTSGDADTPVFIADGSGSERLAAPAELADLPAELLALPARKARNDRLEIVRFAADGRGTRSEVARVRTAGRRPTAVAVDPLQVFAPDDASSTAMLVARVRRAGWTFDVPLTADRRILSSLGRSPFLAGRRCTLAPSGDGVELRREWPSGRWREAAGRAARAARRMSRRR
ncbi:glycosyltransferase [Microbacterium sp. NPDC055312]